MILTEQEFEVIRRVIYDHGLIDSYWIANHRDVEELRRRFNCEDLGYRIEDGLKRCITEAEEDELERTSLLFSNKGEQ